MSTHDNGTHSGPDSLVGLVYDELRGIARHYLGRERRGHTLQPTAVVHEAWLRLSHRSDLAWNSRTHFLAIAATEMRRVLVEHARLAAAKKRGSELTRVSLGEGHIGSSPTWLEILAVDQALHRLRRRSPRQSQVAELKLFAGLTIAEMADAVATSERTVAYDWKVARAFLARSLRTTTPSTS